MKLAIVGKGGVGKTTLAAALARRLGARKRPVIAVDADPDGNLAAALGVAEERVPAPIVQMKELIRERTCAGEAGGGLMFTLNPRVDDLPEQFSVDARGVRLFVLGTVESGGQGCMCPAGAVLKALLQHLLLRVPDDVILDMEAGLEHLGRASARGVDAMIAVVEPGMRSVQTARRVKSLAADIGITSPLVVANRIRSRDQEEALRESLDGFTLLGSIPYCPELVSADLAGLPVELGQGPFAKAIDGIGERLEQLLSPLPAKAD
jgi:CO dehydrogenase maturation factor